MRRRQHPSNWTKEEYETSHRLRGEGKTIKQVAALIGRSEVSVITHLREPEDVYEDKYEKTRKDRKCLKCLKMFVSDWNGDRICGMCKQKNVFVDHPFAPPYVDADLFDSDGDNSEVK